MLRYSRNREKSITHWLVRQPEACESKSREDPEKLEFSAIMYMIYLEARGSLNKSPHGVNADGLSILKATSEESWHEC